MATPILFVDDDADLRQLVTDQLSAAGYDVDVAQDADEAMAKLQGRGYGVLLLDVTLPNKSGMEVLKFTKEKQLPCKVIMLTGMIGLSSAIESMKLGAIDYITKPYNVNYLLASIKKAITE